MRHSRPLVALLGMMAAPWACADAQPEPKQHTPTPAQHVVTPTTLARLSTGPQEGLEQVYRDAIERAGKAWAQRLAQGDGFVASGDENGLEVVAPTARIKRASFELELQAHVAGPNKKVLIRERQQVGDTQVEAEARSAAEAEPLLQAACQAYADLIPRGAGEEITLAAGELVHLTAAGGSQAFSYNRYANSCAVFLRTSDRCREQGVHPLDDCTYTAGDGMEVQSRVVCELGEGEWTCEDIQPNDTIEGFPPLVADMIALELNAGKTVEATNLSSEKN